MPPREDRRKRRTRTALVQAFNELVLEGEDREIRVADIINRADIGRSTFYEHYSSVDEIHREALARPLSALADAVVGAGDEQALLCLLEHFQENRTQARKTFSDSHKRDHVVRVLLRLLEDRLGPSESDRKKLALRQLAEAPVALVRVWICGEITCTTASLAHTILQSSQLLMETLKSDPADPQEGSA